MKHKYKSQVHEKWHCVMKDFESSGLSGAEFCRRKKLYYPSFAKWRRRLLGPIRKPSKSTKPSVFAKIEGPVPKPRSSDFRPTSLRLPNGVLVSLPELPEVSWLLELGGLR